MMPRMGPTVHPSSRSGTSEVRRYTMQVTPSSEFVRVKRASGVAPSAWVRDYVETRLPAYDILRVAQWAVVAGLIGARLYEVIFNWDYYGLHPTKIIAVWEGGLAIHGGLILGPIVGVWLARRWRLPILRSLDVAAPSI